MNHAANRRRIFQYSRAIEFAQAKAANGRAMILLGSETPSPIAMKWLRTFDEGGASPGVVHVGSAPVSKRLLAALHTGRVDPGLLDVVVPAREDPLELDQVIALKMLLNAQSTAIMAKLGRVVGNTMTAVQPGNLKLIGRATFLIQSHVNTVLAGEAWRKKHGTTSPITYAEANAVLFDVIDHRASDPALASSPEVELAIVRILESLARQRAISLDDAAALLRARKLDAYLGDYDH